jgi:hypothetical protein
MLNSGQMKIIKKYIYSLSISSLLFIWLSETIVLAQKEDVKALKQYLLQDFSVATIKFRSGSIRTESMNYNMVTQKMVFKKGDEFLDVTNSEIIDTISFLNRKFVPYDKVFLEIIRGSMIPFYIQHKSDLVSAGQPAGYGTTSQTSSITSISSLQVAGGIYNLKLPDEYNVNPKPVNYIKMDGKMVSFVNEKQFLNIFPGKEKIIKQFIKENKIKFSSQKDLVKLINFCVTL